jgi:hypothetical protein
VIFYIDLNGQKKGPYTLRQLQKMWTDGVVTGKTLYCEEGGTRWRNLEMMQSFLQQESAPAAQPIAKRGFVIVLTIGLILLAIVVFASQCK